MKQKSFSALAYENKKKLTRREKFLAEMDKVIPWGKLTKPIKRYYPKAGNGRRPMPLETMLRIYFMQQWYGLSDPAMEDALYDIESMRCFAGLDLSIDAIPDESTICKFRHLLERHELTARLFGVIEQHLSEAGMIMNKGTIVDATIINAPPSTKNRSKTRDPEMASTKKGNQWYFGMKVHVGAESGRGLVHSAVVTDAAVHDSQAMDELLHGEEEVVYGDKAYANDAKKQDYEANGVRWRINRKARRGQGLSERDRRWNRKSNRTRAKGEHVFHVVKHLWGHKKVRYRGLAKNAAQFFSLIALANIYLVRRRLLQAQA